MKTFKEFLNEEVEYNDIEKYEMSVSQRVVSAVRAHGYTGFWDMKALGTFAGGKAESIYLFELSDYDKSYFNVKLKSGQKLYRYMTDQLVSSKLMPVIAVSAKHKMVYFVENDTDEDDKNLVVSSKGEKLQFFTLLKPRK